MVAPRSRRSTGVCFELGPRNRRFEAIAAATMGRCGSRRASNDLFELLEDGLIARNGGERGVNGAQIADALGRIFRRLHFRIRLDVQHEAIHVSVCRALGQRRHGSVERLVVDDAAIHIETLPRVEPGSSRHVVLNQQALVQKAFFARPFLAPFRK